MAAPVKQTPKERLIPNNERIKAPSGKTTWKIKTVRPTRVGEVSGGTDYDGRDGDIEDPDEADTERRLADVARKGRMTT